MPKKSVLIVSAVVLIAVVAVVIWNQQADQPPPEPVAAPTPPPVIAPPPEPVSLPEPEIMAAPEIPDIVVVAPPPSVENSDSQVLLAVADFAPKLSQWLLPNEQIRKWVLAVDLMADGKLPKRYRPVDFPMDKFATGKQGEQTVITDSNFSRMNAIVETVTTIDPAVLASYYKEWLPTLEKAYREQGKSDSFDQRLQQTISQVLAADGLEKTPELVRPGVLYQYADKNLEQASDVEKLLWRMGPENTEQLQAYLRELRNQLAE
jgi:hypothetical protein